MDKEIKFIDLESMQTSLEEFLLAKIDIESQLETKAQLVDFITGLNLTKVYVYRKQMISFSYVEGNNYNYMFYMLLKNLGNSDDIKKLKEEALQKFKEKMKNLDYDLSSLTQKTNYEIISTGIDVLDFGEYFILNGEFYV